ncbi:hypothetical protein P5V15_011417 [Pogonomyrmex californicus]
MSAGICGSVHDAKIWHLSDIRTFITQDENRYFQNQYHLLADSRRFDTKHSKTRVVIECTFGTLKGRFRKLKYIYMYNTEMIPLVILTCCILHNICIENEDALMDEDAFDALEIQNNDIVFISGAKKRNIISHLF